MIDDMVWAFAGLMALIAVYFVWRARVHNDVSKASGDDANAAALEKSISQQLTMAQLEVKLEQAQAEAALLQTQVQESQLKHTQMQAQLGQLSVDNASLQTRLEAQQEAPSVTTATAAAIAAYF